MNEKLNLRRARIVELKHRLDDWETVALRHELGGGWELAGDNKRWTDDELHATFKASQVLAEFELTLADLLPEGCTRFEFNDGVLGTAYYARRFREDPHHHRDDLWNVTAIAKDAGGAFKLGNLERRFDIDLDTVVPLQVHPQHVEERR